MKENKQVSILAIPVGREPVLRFIPSTTEDRIDALQEIVGGHFGSSAMTPHLHLYSNEDGLWHGLPYNRCGFVGNLVIVKISAAGNPISLTDKDVAKAKEWLDRNDHRPPFCHVCGKPGGTTLFCPCRDVLIYCVGCYNQLAEIMGNSDETAQRRFCLCPRCRKG